LVWLFSSALLLWYLTERLSYAYHPPKALGKSGFVSAMQYIGFGLEYLGSDR
jgi:hypothetical protein